ncbi:hypothetical protein COCSADRAFT_305553 [Bipolaris sorokiniana ND90Pr]|uniref:Uncharacterized protein n=1 Tax=Cochliobolus sativus (strain ND90Pr / ATCC 201652) TaxID=665912 RepID=M2T926_COCSN|nr:uncharacterized protein COCSADRAFT_305553 [Bipolaris sorokiniana ND90Pr]EMD65437.1 hypothetical protein COCSADRAFT_305553 [Bipolaris sorokiniana ND90Pr]
MVKEAERRREQRLENCAFLSSPVLPSSWWCDSACGYSRERPQLLRQLPACFLSPPRDPTQSYPSLALGGTFQVFLFFSFLLPSLLAISSFAPITRPGLRGPSAWEVALSIACSMAVGGGGATPPTDSAVATKGVEREVRNAGEWSGQGMAWSGTQEQNCRERPFSLFCTVCAAAID